MVDSIINYEDASKADVVLIAANYDRTSSFGKGSDKGPKAIRDCLDTQIEFYERFTGTEPCIEYKIAYVDMGDLNDLSPEEMVKTVASEFGKHYDASKFVILLGGEHSVSNGPFKVVASKNKPEDVTVFQIDAHADLRFDDSDYNDKPFGKYAHSCVMRRAYELELKTVQVGIRAFSKEEHDFIKEHDLTVWRWDEELEPSEKEIIDSIRTDKVYLTVDTDGIDPAHMPATGTPVQGGLEWWYTLRLLQKLFKEKDVIGADIVEVAPRPNDTLTEYGAAQICYNLIAFKMAGNGK